jgi:hypothetical protein
MDFRTGPSSLSFCFFKSKLQYVNKYNDFVSLYWLALLGPALKLGLSSSNFDGYETFSTIYKTAIHGIAKLLSCCTFAMPSNFRYAIKQQYI